MDTLADIVRYCIANGYMVSAVVYTRILAREALNHMLLDSAGIPRYEVLKSIR